MFGLKHCIYYNCLMNGSNSLDESDQKPLEPCPVCMRKLLTAVRFNPFERYEHLQNFCKATQGYFKPFFKFYGDLIDKTMMLRDYSIHILKEVYGNDHIQTSSSPLKVLRDQYVQNLTNPGAQTALPIQFVTPRIIEILQNKSPQKKTQGLI